MYALADIENIRSKFTDVPSAHNNVYLKLFDSLIDALEKALHMSSFQTRMIHCGCNAFRSSVDCLLGLKSLK